MEDAAVAAEPQSPPVVLVKEQEAVKMTAGTEANDDLGTVDDLPSLSSEPDLCAVEFLLLSAIEWLDVNDDSDDEEPACANCGGRGHRKKKCKKASDSEPTLPPKEAIDLLSRDELAQILLSLVQDPETSTVVIPKVLECMRRQSTLADGDGDSDSSSDDSDDDSDASSTATKYMGLVMPPDETEPPAVVELTVDEPEAEL
ncbi:hypothetical protein B0H63DRAFT_105426 [Podospora didyma]|uniref:CCHC-type domain-containing protein n=1 Tax=Podospora didyma TaxID=330526 RepID=A0AAE0U3V4_9PEZI|nr:hypothetical protein B0H63DRAFT_105426 [Podospora didyma]